MQTVNATNIRQGSATVRLVSAPANAVIVQGSSVSSSTGISSQHKTHAVLQQVQGSYSGGQPIIVTIANHDEGGSKTRDLTVNQRSNQIVYQAQQSYPEYNQNTGYSSCYQNADSATIMSSGVAGHVITEAGESYLIQTNIDSAGGQLTHTIRASPVTVQWLLDNYETAETVSLPRSTLYNHYIRHCSDNKLEPMNPASFGKLIRSVFPGLRTRRLGTRGNSQYHYYGIRIKSMSPLNQISADSMFSARQQSFGPVKRHKSESEEGSVSASDGSAPSQPSASATANSQQYELGEVSADIIPDLGHIELSDDEVLPPGLTDEHVIKFENMYKNHCKGFLDIVINLKFPLVETLWTKFWRKMKTDVDSDDSDVQLSVHQLYSLCQLPSVQQFVRRSDYSFYQVLVHVLVPDVLRPIPSQLTQSIRNFAKNLENWLKNSMTGAPEDITKIKLTAVRSFAQILRRYTSLNHLAQAARAVLQNSNQITQMLTDLNKVDFTSVQEQASWVCRCEDATIRRLEQDFKRTLQQLTPLEQWAEWLEAVVNDSLEPHTSDPDFPKAARQFLLKWSFYSSMVIRDLTLRSAASFGSFHLIRLLYDEYMFYLVEHKVASAVGETSVAVMADFRNLLNVDSLTSEAAESVLPSQHDAVQQSAPANGAVAVKPAAAVIVKSSATVSTSGSVLVRDVASHVTVATDAAAMPTATSGRTAVIHPLTISQQTAACVAADTAVKPAAKRTRTD